MSNSEMIQCYNRGCGQKYNPSENSDDSCRHHPGVPVFHDAYKGWSCCSKKCTDFTEFLNITGCTLSKHSNEKPVEPEKPVAKDVPDVQVIEVKPILPSVLKRPPFETPMVNMTPEVAPSLKQQLANPPQPVEIKKEDVEDTSVVQMGTSCKNGGCTVTYQGSETDATICLHHPGYPVFHEGLKFWTCCQKRTSDFTSFLNQIGCQRGSHLWVKEDVNNQDMQCRWDHHQTGAHVVVSIYAKNYCPTTSEVKLNPIRLFINLVFPQDGGATFKLDFELRGIIDVPSSQVTMYGTKVEIKMKKAEPGSWSRLEVPRSEPVRDEKQKKKQEIEGLTPRVEAVDLSDL